MAQADFCSLLETNNLLWYATGSLVTLIYVHIQVNVFQFKSATTHVGMPHRLLNVQMFQYI